ncbi:hypothetical protein ACJJTC_012252 [Scirpophaga incertulas]
MKLIASSITCSSKEQSQTAVLDLTRRRRAGAVSVSQARRAGAARGVHSPRDIGKRNAKKLAPGACDLGESLTTTDRASIFEIVASGARIAADTGGVTALTDAPRPRTHPAPPPLFCCIFVVNHSP